MAYDANGMWTPEDSSVENRLGGLLKKSSPYIDRARTGAALTANRRGVVNSSIAAGAGEAAAIDAALPIASQDAAQTQQSNISRQTFGQESELSKQSFNQQGGLIRIGADEQIRTEAARHGQNVELAKLDQASRERIAQLDVDTRDRQGAQQAATSVVALYSDLYAKILADENLPAATRDAAQVQAAELQKANLNLVEQLWGIQIDWPTDLYTPPGTATTPPPATTTTTTPPPSQQESSA